MRGDRTHPLKWSALSLGTLIALALLGASDQRIRVVAAYLNGTCMVPLSF